MIGFHMYLYLKNMWVHTYCACGADPRSGQYAGYSGEEVGRGGESSTKPLYSLYPHHHNQQGKNC